MAEASETRTHSNPRRVSEIRLFIRALGVSFFSVVSVLVALYAFMEMPQTQDVLLDARPYWIQEVIYWTSFYVIGILFWALPLVFTARLLLLQNFDSIGIDTENRFKFYIFVMPRFYAVIAFFAVLIGMIYASENLPSPSSGNQYEIALRRILSSHLIMLCGATALITFMIMVRDLFISYYSRRMELLELNAPRRCREELIRIENLTRKSTRKQEEHDLHLTALKPDFLTTHTWIAAQRAKLFMWGYMSVLTCLLLVLVGLHFLSYSETVRSAFAIRDMDLASQSSIRSAWSFLAETFSLKRAPLLFILFGAWLPFVTLMALLSNRHQFPFITAFILSGVILSLFIGDGHNIRLATLSESQRAALKPVGFADALKAWKSASGWNAKGCEQFSAGASELAACPRPIIVAGEGGGSRAAFLFASVLGALEDDSLDRQKNPDARPFHNQLFATSTVSGSSVGAAFFVSALKAQPAILLGQLKKGLYRQRLWFPNVATAKPVVENAGERIGKNFLTDFVTYKDALQAALSNDFISPTLIAYLARDVSMISRFPFVMDRAGVLETAWEDAFDDVYGTSKETSPLSAPLQAMAPSPESWTPLLFMNATSIETGRRVIVTPVRINEPISGGATQLFTDVYDLHELLCSPYRDSVTKTVPPSTPLDEIGRALPSLFRPEVKCEGEKPVSVDIRLSTAASVSSRSPFITPHADIRDRRSQLTDSVVDGGFFDNSGIITALDVARGVKTIDARIMPFILQVSNEPAWFEASKNCSAEGAFPARPQIPDEAIFRPLSALTDLLTVNSTRISRGYETILELPQRASQLNGGISSAAQIHVCPQPEDDFFRDMLFGDAKDKSMRMMNKAQHQEQYKSVSLSWWLSPPLQAYLDGQIYNKHNVEERNCVISLLMDNQPGEAASCH
jgi:hypothetical protein